MIGRNLLVAPVTETGTISRTVYLPDGVWFHLWTGTAHTGPTEIIVEAPIGSPPVFSRGSDRAEFRAIQSSRNQQRSSCIARPQAAASLW